MDKKEFFELLDKYLAGQCSPQEEQQLLSFYNSFQGSEELPKDLDLQKLENKMLTGIKNTIRQENEPVIVTLFPWRRLIAAAVIILIVSSGLYFYITRDHLSNTEGYTTAIKNDVAPGDNKAVLTLADGSNISLYDAANGILANQGNMAISKTTKGQIVYQKKTDNISGAEHSLINTIRIPKGGKYMVVLSDGSKVWLNSASSLSYPITFTGNERKVKLKGEAYFEVVHDDVHPFRVESNNQIVEDLGTHFNINSYEDEGFTKTTLLEGSVRVILNATKDHSRNTQLLKPGQQSLINSSQGGIKVENADIEKAVAWKNGYFRFNKTRIQDIMKEMERWYDVKAEYVNGKIPADEFTGYISRDVKLSSVLKILEGETRFEINGKTIKIITE